MWEGPGLILWEKKEPSCWKGKSRLKKPQKTNKEKKPKHKKPNQTQQYLLLLKQILYFVLTLAQFLYAWTVLKSKLQFTVCLKDACTLWNIFTRWLQMSKSPAATRCRLVTAAVFFPWTGSFFCIPCSADCSSEAGRSSEIKGTLIYHTVLPPHVTACSDPAGGCSWRITAAFSLPLHLYVNA